MQQNKILLTGGGTAGHVLPHLALCEEDNDFAMAIRNNNLQVHYIGSYTGIEKKIINSMQPTWNYHTIFTGKLRRYFSWNNIIDPLKIFLGFLQAILIIIKIKPKVVFSKGGFVAVPVVWAAWLCRIPIILHESDASPGLATKLTILFAQKALFAFSEAITKFPNFIQQKNLVVGLPIRRSLFSSTEDESLNFFNFSRNLKILFICGGSLGAKSLNEKIRQILPELLKKYQIIHLTGPNNKIELPKLQYIDRYKQFEFLNAEIRYAYAVADLAICRSGASTIFELARAQIPMILMPLGLKSSRGDQILNTKIFAQRGWAQYLDEDNFAANSVLNLIDSTIQSLAEKKINLQLAATMNSAEKVGNILWNIIVR